MNKIAHQTSYGSYLGVFSRYIYNKYDVSGFLQGVRIFDFESMEAYCF